jgi:hypothetical protein
MRVRRRAVPLADIAQNFIDASAQFCYPPFADALSRRRNEAEMQGKTYHRTACGLPSRQGGMRARGGTVG